MGACCEAHEGSRGRCYEVRHGTQGCYRSGCRCDLCRDVEARRQREFKARRAS